MRPKISIIVPIYKTEAFLERCLRSIMAQTLSEIEIICVDDASPDQSAAIVQRLAREDGRISLIRHNSNRGLGAARNSGLAAARAPYVTGVDSDDWIKPEMMARLWEESGEGEADIVASGYARVKPDGTPAGPKFLPDAGRFRNDNLEIDIFQFLMPSFWGKIWRKSLFDDNSIRFPEDIYFEDLAITPQLAHFAKDIRVITDDLYQYVIRSGSISNNHGIKHLTDHFRVFEILDDFLNRENLMERYKTEFMERICKSQVFHASKVNSTEMDLPERQQYLRFMLMLQIGFIEYKDHLRDVHPKTLQSLIRATHSRKALDERLSKTRSPAGTDGRAA